MTSLQELAEQAGTRSPSLAGGLPVNVACAVDRGHRRSRRHEVVIEADWSVTTPHDLDAERLAVALGGYLSCLELVDRVVPAVRVYVERQRRLTLPRLTKRPDGRWRAEPQVRGCCPRGGVFRSPVLAAEHLRAVGHVAAEHHARASTVAAVGRVVLRARTTRDGAPPPTGAAARAAACVVERSGVTALWGAGLHPDVVAAIHRHVACDGTLLPVGFYLGVLVKRPDLAWIARCAAAAPGSDVHEWLAWSQTPADRDDPTLRAAWLRAGISRGHVQRLSAAGYAPSDVERLAAGVGRSTTTAAALLVTWLDAGCRPQVGELIGLHQLGAPSCGTVNRAAVDRLAVELKERGIRARREQVAGLLAACGSCGLALAVIRDGELPDAATAVQRLREYDEQRASAGDHS